jgi:AcrR family transcriptional regulator
MAQRRTPVKSTLTKRQEARRDRLVQAAMELAATGGYEAVQMREVAARAEVALGTLYRYFSSKDQLLVGVLASWARDLQRRLNARPPQEPDPADRVAEVFRRATRAMERAPQLTEAVITALSSLSAEDPSGLSAAREVYEVVTDIITEAMANGPDRRDAVIRILAQVWFATLFARVRGWADPKQTALDMEDAVRLMVANEPRASRSLAYAEQA